MSLYSQKVCPSCGSKIKAPDGSGEQTWDNDPIRTFKGLSGKKFKGFQQIKKSDLLDIKNKLEELGIKLENFNLTERGYNIITKQHIKKIREGIEKYINESNITKKYIFQYDELGNIKDKEKEDWYNKNLDITLTKIKANHIEDLRHLKEKVGPLYWMSLRNRHRDVDIQSDLIPIVSWNTASRWMRVNPLFSPVINWPLFHIPAGDYCSPENLYLRYRMLSPSDTGYYRPGYKYYVSHFSRVEEGHLSVTHHKIYARRSRNFFSNWKASILIEPRNPDIMAGEIEEIKIPIKEIMVDSQLINDTPRYPAEVTRQEPINPNFVPKFKSCGFLEDGVDTNNVDLIPHYENNVFIKENGTPCQQNISSYENLIIKRNVDTRSMSGRVRTPGCKNRGSSYFNGVSIQSTQIPIGNHSIFIPENWDLNNLKQYKESAIIEEYPITFDDWKYHLSIREYVMGPSLNNPTPSFPGSFYLRFRNDCLLTKDDGVDFIAKKKITTGKTISPDTEYIDIPEDAIKKRILITDSKENIIEYEIETIEGEERLVFQSTPVLYTQKINITYYSDEVNVDNWYAGGIISTADGEISWDDVNLPNSPFTEKDTSKEGNKLYIAINYYQVPHNYNEIRSPYEYHTGKNYYNDWKESYSNHSVIKREPPAFPSLYLTHHQSRADGADIHLNGVLHSNRDYEYNIWRVGSSANPSSPPAGNVIKL